MKSKTTKAIGTPEARGRRRLPADVRVNQILDAALVEFSARGYSATRVDDIAARAGLSKGGIYTHFDSKDEVFEALLDRMLVSLPFFDEELALAPGPVTVDLIIKLLVDDAFVWLAREPVAATFRLLLAESARVPRQVELFHQRANTAVTTMLGRLVRKGVEQGTLRAGVVLDHPWLIAMPVLHSVLKHSLLGRSPTSQQVERDREAYVQLLRELLAVPGDATAAPRAGGRE